MPKRTNKTKMPKRTNKTKTNKMSEHNKNDNSPSLASASSPKFEIDEAAFLNAMYQCKDKIEAFLMPASASSDVNSSPPPKFEIDPTMVSDIFNRAKEDVGELLTSVARWRDEAEDSASPDHYVTERVQGKLHHFFTLRKAFAEIKPSGQDQDPSPTPSASSSVSEIAEALVSDTLDRAKQELMSELSEVSDVKKKKTPLWRKFRKRNKVHRITMLKKDKVSQPLPTTEAQVKSPAMCSASDKEDLVEKEIPGENATGTEEEGGLRQTTKKKKWWRNNFFKRKQVLPIRTLKKDEVSQPLPATEAQVKSPAMCSASDKEDHVEKEIPGEDGRGTEEKDDLSPVNMRLVDSEKKLEDSVKDTPITSTPGTPQLFEFSEVSLASVEEDLVEKEIPGEDATDTEEKDDLSPVNMRLVDSEKKLKDSVKDTPITSTPGTPQLFEFSEVSLASDEEDHVEKEIPGEDATGTEEKDDLSPVNMRLVDSEKKLEDSVKDTPITSTPGTPQLFEFSEVSLASVEEDLVEKEIPGEDATDTEEKDDLSPVNMRLVDSEKKLEDSVKDTPITSTPGTPQLFEFSEVNPASVEEDLVEKEIPGEDATGTEEKDDLSPVNMRLVDSEKKLEDSVKDTQITSTPGTPQLFEFSEVNPASDEEDLVEKEIPGEDATGTEKEGRLRQMTEITVINNNNKIITGHVKKKKTPLWRNISRRNKVHPITTLKKDEVSQPLPATEAQVKSPARTRSQCSASDKEDLVEKEMPGDGPSSISSLPQEQLNPMIVRQQMTSIIEEELRQKTEITAINNNNEVITDHVQKKKMPWWRKIFKRKKVLPVTTLKKDE
ncbi:hypothetical protein D9C73_019623 [Collichthys lucidus]|uniref:Uncharacterized protein n=1 Tax=Collichthys lucidus TaxID=240159 RepID=A0A4U5VCU4_COLLU|nr:hypothetical protein D9C73_019623 [Collichthys lucidus]